MQANFIRLLVLAAALVAVPLTAILVTDATSALAHSRPQRMTKRLVSQMVEARKAGDSQEMMLRLKAIDPSRAPATVQRAFSNYLAAVEANATPDNADLRRAESAFQEAVARVMRGRKAR